MTNQTKSLLLVAALFLGIRFIPYLTDFVPTGYDAGIYVNIIKAFPPMPEWIIPQYYSFLFLLTWPLKFFHPEQTVIPLSFIIQLVFFICFFYAVKRLTDFKTALIAAILLSVSAIQIRVYWFFYLKYILSIAFLLTSLSFWGKKRFYHASAFGFLTVITHLLTGTILLPVLAIDLVFSRTDRLKKSLSLLVILAGGLLFYRPYFQQTIITNFFPTFANLTSLDASIKEGGGGTFYPIYISALLAIFYLPLSWFGLKKTWQEKRGEWQPFLITLLLTLLLIALRVSFYRRIVVITDAVLLMYAALGWSKVAEIKKFYLATLILFAMVFSYRTGSKLISPSNLTEIQALRPSVGHEYLLSTAKEDTAWLLGYTDAKVIAWGYGGFDTFWTKDQWETFFNPYIGSQQKIQLLEQLPEGTYLYVDDVTAKNLSALLQSGYLTPISAHVYLLK